VSECSIISLQSVHSPQHHQHPDVSRSFCSLVRLPFGSTISTASSSVFPLITACGPARPPRRCHGIEESQHHQARSLYPTIKAIYHYSRVIDIVETIACRLMMTCTSLSNVLKIRFDAIVFREVLFSGLCPRPFVVWFIHSIPHVDRATK
jgi:hypothetical protein